MYMDRIVSLLEGKIVYINPQREHMEHFDDAVVQFCEEFEEVTNRNPNLDTLLNFTCFSITSVLSPSIRRKIIDIIKPLQGEKTKLALVGISSVAKVMVDVILHISGNRDEMRSFKSVEEALAWLRS